MAVLLVLVLATVGCTADTPRSQSGPSRTARTETGLPDVTHGELIDLFAGAGITTYASAADGEPVQPVSRAGAVSLTDWQVQTMQRGIASGTGFSARDLDDLTQETGSVVPLSIILAAWLTDAQTGAAQAARTLKTPPQPGPGLLDTVYPNAVLSLFVQDMAGPTTAAASAGPQALAGDETTGMHPAAYLEAADGACSDLVNFLSNSLDSIVKTLKFDLDNLNGASKILASIWNTVVEFAASALKETVAAFAKSVLSPITKAITLVALLSSAASLLNPWTVKTTVTPADNVDPGTDVTVTADVDVAVDFSWPTDVKDCASVLGGVDLPDPGNAAESPVTWPNFTDPESVTTGPGQADTAVDDQQQARFHFTAKDKEDPDAHQLTGVAPVTVGVHLQRTQVNKISDLVTGMLLNGLPSAARKIVDALLGGVESKARAALDKLVSVDGDVTQIDVNRYDVKPSTTPNASPSACADASATAIPDGVWTGPLTFTLDGESTLASGAIHTTTAKSSSLTLTVKDGTVTSGTWHLTLHGDGTIKPKTGGTATADLTAQIKGTVNGTATQPDLDGTSHLTGTVDVTVQGFNTSAPINETTSSDRELTLVDVTCDQVTGTFLPSLNAKGMGIVTFAGEATWTGHPEG